MLHLLSLQILDRSRDVVCSLSLQNVEVRVALCLLGLDLPRTVDCRLPVTSASLSLNLLLESHLEVECSLSLRTQLASITIGGNQLRNVQLRHSV